MKERIITGVILGLITLIAIICLPTWLFEFVLLGVVLIASSEWKNMQNVRFRYQYGIINMAILIIAFILMQFQGVNSSFEFFSSQILFFINEITGYLWLLIPLIIIAHARIPQKWFLSDESIGILSSLTLLGFFVSLSLLRNLQGSWGYSLLLYVIILTICADSGAYFIGRKFGKRKLASTISPGKTFEGAVGGLIIALIFILSVMVFLPPVFNNWQKLGFLSISLIATVLSVFGDLYESLIKRHAGVKDSGAILPGHGGVLDRVDGLIASSTFFVFGFYALALNNQI